VNQLDGNAFVYALNGMNLEGEPCYMPCIDEYCAPCAMRECKHGEPLHGHHDGCPAYRDEDPCGLPQFWRWMDLQYQAITGRMMPDARR
jgi:hypothetical protein